jgi:ankyrin repeat protein
MNALSLLSNAWGTCYLEQAIQYLIQQEIIEPAADINKADGRGTPMHVWSVSIRHELLLDQLFEQPILVPKADESSVTPASYRRIVLPWFVCANLHTGSMPLHSLGARGHYEVVTSLIAANADVDKADLERDDVGPGAS